MGVFLILFFVACAIASAFSSYGVAGVALSAIAAAIFVVPTLAGTMQFRHRARLRGRLQENGVRTRGLIMEMWVIEGSYGGFSVLRYSIRTQDGETRTYAAYDRSAITWKWAVGDSIGVIYDPDRPHLAIVDDN